MNEFWLWFWRPLAETLGALAGVGAILGLLLLAGAAVALKNRIKAAFHGMFSKRG